MVPETEVAVDDAVKAYIDKVSDGRRALLERLRTILLEAFPGVEEALWWNMPTYRSGGGWVALGYRKDGISLYTCSADHIAAFKAAHPRIRSGKACLNFRPKDTIPVEDVVEVARHAFENAK
ncbi:MAG TPA: DUF1801 domain-containing protein [Anaerolineae bacterium]|nr:DUF1801 domain-containing protein [Anaerolineae bacterium]